MRAFSKSGRRRLVSSTVLVVDVTDEDDDVDEEGEEGLVVITHSKTTLTSLSLRNAWICEALSWKRDDKRVDWGAMREGQLSSWKDESG